MVRIAVIVEGKGEVQAVPELLRRIIAEVSAGDPPSIARPIRAPRDRIVKEGELERYVNLAVSHGGPDARILVLLDADEDCPKELGPELLRRAREARPDKQIQVVLAAREYEAWFIAAAESTVSGVSAAPQNPEAIRGAKEWIGRYQPYRPTADQAPMTATFDMAEARRNAPSFDKMWRAVEALLAGPRPAKRE